VTEFGFPRRHFRVTDSTNERARELAEAGAPSGAVLTASSQTAGRGRRGRVWTAPRDKALLYSTILRPLDAGDALLPLAVPVAVCEAIESEASVRCEIKWPNDVWISEHKVAGILIEARPPDWAVIGVGVNVAIEADEFPADLRWPAISVGHGATPDSIRAALDRQLGAWVDAEPEEVLSAFRDRDALAGREISWVEEGTSRSGTAIGIDARGNLLVETGEGERVALGAGEVQLQVPSTRPR
jgi:BirA family transcriptional regulator, biotin operon repressor / biotin---[acetyl-CoA-carboxylase] ligase